MPSKISTFSFLFLLQWVSLAVASSHIPYRAVGEYMVLNKRQSSEQNECVKKQIQCGPTPPCNCERGLICQLSEPICNVCSVPVCVSVAELNGAVDEETSDGPSVGPIVGGVVGGLAVLGLIGFFVYKKKFKSGDMRETDNMSENSEKAGENFGMLKSARASTHTIASVASNFSNVIQIAYVPGVQSRSGPSSPAVPPVPMIPDQHRDSGVVRQPQSPVDEVFFLMPSRASTYTQATNRSSIATTIYGANAVVAPVPANVVRAGKAAVVQVKSTTNSAASTPEIPQSSTIPSLPKQRRTAVGAKSPLGMETDSSEPASPTFSIGSTFHRQMVDKQQKEREEIEEIERRRRAENSENVLKSESYAQNRLNRSSYLSTDMDTGSPFSDSNSVDSVSIDDLPLPPGSGMPPASVHRNSRIASPALSSRTSQSTINNDRRSPFHDLNQISEERR